MELIPRLFDSFLFWSAWIIIPVIVEIVPSIGTVIVLAKRRSRQRNLALQDERFFPEVSLIIPVYNSAETLEECIKSVYDSTYPNDKIRMFMVDNGSSDDSFRVFAACQQKYSEIRMQWMKSQQGKSRALNMALYNSEGKYVVNIDSDGIMERRALECLIRRFESDSNINCMSGAILTNPDFIEAYSNPLSRLLRKLEFMEYAQAFFAGRSYSAELDAVYTMSGAFCGFRKNAILSSRLYNTNTLAEDTQLTFQMRYLQHEHVEMCDDAIFLVDPIDDVDKLYTQRQRWQRGSLEVAHLFPESKMSLLNVFSDINVYTLTYDHTFAFPRIIWYVALLCLVALNVSAKIILISMLMIFTLYTMVGYLYFVSISGHLRIAPDLRTYYCRHWWVVALLPFYNLCLFFIRFAGIINSIGTQASWKTRTLSEEGTDFRKQLKISLAGLYRPIRWMRSRVNDGDEL